MLQKTLLMLYRMQQEMKAARRLTEETIREDADDLDQRTKTA